MLQVSISSSIEWECVLGDADKYCEIIMTLLFSFVTLGFGEAQAENCVFGIAMPRSKDSGKFREMPLVWGNVLPFSDCQVELAGGDTFAVPWKRIMRGVFYVDTHH